MTFDLANARRRLREGPSPLEEMPSRPEELDQLIPFLGEDERAGFEESEATLRIAFDSLSGPPPLPGIEPSETMARYRRAGEVMEALSNAESLEAQLRALAAYTGERL
jgi:hypothetical protein